MAPNIELLDKIIAKIEEQPESWDQEFYARKKDDSPCGTAYCVAGWAAVLSGRTFNWQEPIIPREWSTLEDKVYFSDYPEHLTDGAHVAWYAQNMLVLSDEDADALFDCANTLDEIKEMRDNLARNGYLKEEDDPNNLELLADCGPIYRVHIVTNEAPVPLKYLVKV